MVSSGEKTVLTVTPKKETPVAGELILNCLFAIVTVVNPEDWNAVVPILVTIFPTVTLVNPVRTVEGIVGIEVTLAVYEKFGKFVFRVKASNPLRVVP